MKILFILGTYLPKPSPNGICVEKVANELVQHGNKVVCLCSKNHYDKEYHEIINGVDIYRVKANRLNNLSEQLQLKGGNVSRILSGSIIYYLKLISLLLKPFWPLDFSGRSGRLYRKAKSLHKKYMFDRVICVHKPLHSLIVGSRLKEEYPEIKYVPYFLDSLSGGFKERLYSDRANLKRKIKCEDKYLKNADIVIAMESSRRHHEQNSSGKDYYKKIVYLDIPLMMKLELYNVSTQSDRINIVFGGLLNYPYRNILYLIEIIKNIHRKDIMITFIGKTNRVDIFKKAIEELGNQIQYIDYMPHDEYIPFLKKADFLLNMGVTTPSAISGKIFEYMSYGKPIISTYSIDNEACLPYLKKYPVALMLDEREPDIEKQAKILSEFIDTFRNYRINPEELNEVFYKNTPQAFVEQIEK